MAERDSTRQILLDTAIRLFGQRGYDAVSTRMLAEAAAVNVAAIKYHFGSKDHLYVGAIDAIVDLIEPRLDIVTQLAEHAKAIAGSDLQRQAEVIRQLVNTVLTTLLETPMLQTAIPFVLRELFVPGPHFSRLYEAVPKRLHVMLTDLVAWILSLDPESEAAKVRTHAVVGQIIIFHLGRPILLRRLQTDLYSPKIIDEIRAQATASILSSLGLPNES